MCNTFIFIPRKTSQLKYKLILLNNRDEVLDRATSAAHWEKEYLAGHDEQASERGTWLGITKYGRIGNTLSITEPEHVHKHRGILPTRGRIVSDFLTGTMSGSEYCESLTTQANNYHGFQFLALERNLEDRYEITSLTNRLTKNIKPNEWKEGVYCFGNSPRDMPMKKVAYGEKIFKQFVEKLAPNTDEKIIVNGLMSLAMDSTQHFPDPQLSEQTGRPDSYNRYLSSIYVRFPPEVRYGTRCHTTILIDINNKVYFREHRMQDNPPENPMDAKWETSEFRFELE